MPPNPFFIVGHPRSGTTLLRFMLCSHSKLYIPEETGFLPFLNVSPDKHLSEVDIHNLLARIGKLNYLWRDLPMTAVQLMAKHSRPLLSTILDDLYQMQATRHSAVRWGDKTPLYVQYIPEILAIFPQAQFIHLIRDGRDTALSALQKWGASSSYMDIYYLLKNWVRNVTAGRQFGLQADATQYLEVRYEALVTSRKSVLQQVCSFLGENFELQMLDHTTAAKKAGPGPSGNFEVLLPVAESSVYRWKAEMNEYQRKLSVLIAGDLLHELGYEVPKESPMLPREVFRTSASATRFWFFDSLRMVLYRSGALTLNRTMRTPKTKRL